jgi:hypothetical protein
MEFLMIHIFAFLLISTSFLSQCADSAVPTHPEIDRKKNEMVKACLESCPLSNKCFQACYTKKHSEYIDTVINGIEAHCVNKYIPTDDPSVAEGVRKRLKNTGNHTIEIHDNSSIESKIVANISLCQINQWQEFKQKRDFLEARNERIFNDFRREHPIVGACAANNTCFMALRALGVLKEQD